MPNSSDGLTFTEKELEVFEQIIARPKIDVDVSGRYIGYYIQIKLLGIIPFRILHSGPTWTKIKKLFAEFDVDVESLPEVTSMGEKINGYKWYEDQLPVVTDVWEFLVGIDRRQEGIRQFDPKPNLG